MKKRILVLYQDWNNWFIDNSSKFYFWFEDIDKAYKKENNYFFLVLGNEDKYFKLRENIEVLVVKAHPLYQYIYFFKFRSKLKKVIKDFYPSSIYCPFIYLAFLIPKREKAYKIGFLRDKTGEMISAKGGIRFIIGKLFYLFDYLAFKKLDLILHNGISLEKYARKLKYNHKIIYNPRDIVDKKEYQESFPNKEMFNLKKKGNVILFSIGRLVKGKNMDFAIKTLSNLPKNYHLFIAGEGEEKNYLIELSNKLEISKRVHILGYVHHLDIWQYYKGSDIFWLLSKTDFEGTPNVLQEAFYAKIPCVVSKISAMGNIVENNKSGLVMNSWDEKELALKTKKLMEDKKLYQFIQKEQSKKISYILSKNKTVEAFFK